MEDPIHNKLSYFRRIKFMHALPVIFILFISACGNDSVTEELSSFASDSEWLIPQEEVVDGGPGRDGIPSIDDPKFLKTQNIEYVDDSRMIIGVRVGDVIKAYPHQVMDWHEIVNDESVDIPYCLTYCPLTGTALAWDREIEGETVEYGVSGFLFRNNLIPFDRKTGSLYSQMQARSVQGERSATQLDTRQVIQTTWSTWKKMYPDSQVLTTDTGFERNYGGFAYGSSYLEGDSGALFPINNKDDRLPKKKRVHGIIPKTTDAPDQGPKVYVIDEFGSEINLVEDQSGIDDIIVVGSSDLHFAVSFKVELDDGSIPEFEPVQDELPIIMEDQEGNRWDLFGHAVEGPRQGERLTPTFSYSGYWFAWADFFPGVEIYQRN